MKRTARVGDLRKEEIVAKREATPEAAQSATGEFPRQPARRASRRGQFGGPITLGPDDKRAVPEEPAGFDKRRDDIPHGKREMVEYDSKSVGNKRKAQSIRRRVILSGSKVSRALSPARHRRDEQEWVRGGHPEIILDNLIADKKAEPMIIVMPNGRAQADDRPGPNAMSPLQLLANSTKTFWRPHPVHSVEILSQDRPRESALAGLSMGGGQSLNFGLGIWILCVGGRIFLRSEYQARRRAGAGSAAATKQLKLLWIPPATKTASSESARECILT
jgi:hypothetical protein